MDAFYQYIDEYKKQLAKGDIQRAYKGLMEYIMSVRSYFANKYPDYLASGNIYFGYMDMTYFSLFPKFLKARNLKIAIVFSYDKFRFEVWLAGANKNVQRKYWNLLRENNWSNYHVPSAISGIDSIMEHILVENPDFKDLTGLTEQIERKTIKFIEDIENFLSKQD
jgi:hypothetical protein